jgi:PIN domain
VINLVLDTNILHEEGLHSANMKRLARLVAAGSIAVHIPELVKREYLSKRTSEAAEKSKAFQASLADFSKKFFPEDPMQGDLGQISQSIGQAMAQFSAAVEVSFERWRETVNATVINLDLNSTAKVFEEYFEGKGAFRKLKTREDIPDAFIANAIIELKISAENIHVAVRDGALGKYLITIPGLTISEDVKGFFENPAVNQLVVQFEAGDQKLADLKAFFSGAFFHERLEAALRTDPDLIRAIYVEEDSITGTDHLTIYDFGAAINFPSAEDLDLVNFGDVVYVEEGYFTMPIDFSTSASVDYCTSYGEYAALPTEKMKLVEELGMNGDGVSDIQEKRTIHFFGNIALQFDPAMSITEVIAASEVLAYANSRINLSMTFDTAAILM